MLLTADLGLTRERAFKPLCAVSSRLKLPLRCRVCQSGVRCAQLRG